jgi:hypothetical protein
VSKEKEYRVTTVDSDDTPTSLRAEVARLRSKLQEGERLHTRLLDAVQEAVIATDLMGRLFTGMALRRSFTDGAHRRLSAEM